MELKFQGATASMASLTFITQFWVKPLSREWTSSSTAAITTPLRTPKLHSNQVHWVEFILAVPITILYNHRLLASLLSIC